MGLPQNKHVKLVVMSATMEASLYEEFFKPTTKKIGGGSRILQLDVKSEFTSEILYLDQAIKLAGDELKFMHSLKRARDQFDIEHNSSLTGAKAQLTPAIEGIVRSPDSQVGHRWWYNSCFSSRSWRDHPYA
jgi:hypothetical protein